METYMQCLSIHEECHSKNGQKIVRNNTQSDPKSVTHGRLISKYSELLSLNYLIGINSVVKNLNSHKIQVI